MGVITNISFSRLVLGLFSSALSHNVCHLSMEDVLYMHASVRQNVACLLADLYLALEGGGEKENFATGTTIAKRIF